MKVYLPLFCKKLKDEAVSYPDKKRNAARGGASVLVVDDGFEPSKAEPTDLQSVPIGRSGNPPFLQRAEDTRGFSLTPIRSLGPQKAANMPWLSEKLSAINYGYG